MFIKNHLAATAASAKNYEGFTVQSITQGTIAEDGSTVVKVYYNRNSYNVTYTDNAENAVIFSDVIKSAVYGAAAPSFGSDPTRSGYIFGGWYTDTDCTDENKWDFANDTISGNITLYAKWTEKTDVSINEAPQSYSWDSSAKSFVIDGSPSTGFTVSYMVNSGWTTDAPSAFGSYDVKITRAEDDTYKAYEKTITNGLVIADSNCPMLGYTDVGIITASTSDLKTV